MKNYRGKLAVMSILAVLWSVFEIVLRIATYKTNLEAAQVDESVFMTYTQCQILVFVCVIISGMLGYITLKEPSFWKFAMLTSILAIVASVVFFFTQNIAFNIVTLVCSFMIAYNAFQLRKVK